MSVAVNDSYRDEVGTKTRRIVDTNPRVYVIDLSLPPSERYTEVIQDFRHLVNDLKLLFDQVLTAIKPRILPLWLCHFILWIFLRRTHSREHTGEIYGLSIGFGLPIYILVAYNVLLDLLMGCTSGGVLIKAPGSTKARMHHFRTLDWGMPSLRKAIVQYDFVQGPDGKVIASTIGYVGFVGVLTGVKSGLSISLNFRPYHNAHGWTWANLQYYYHLTMVLLGRKPSIAAHLRNLLLPTSSATLSLKKSERTKSNIRGPTGSNSAMPTQLLDVRNALDQGSTTAAYIILCNGLETLVIEKDLKSSKMAQSSTFITTTNHDLSYESEKFARSDTKQLFLGIGMEDLIVESVERKNCLVRKWDAHQQRQRRKAVSSKIGSEIEEEGIRIQDLKRWMLVYPVCNEETHFVCIMDPLKGVVKWMKCFQEGEINGEDDNM